MLVVRTTNFQGTTISLCVRKLKHSIGFLLTTKFSTTQKVEVSKEKLQQTTSTTEKKKRNKRKIDEKT